MILHIVLYILLIAQNIVGYEMNTAWITNHTLRYYSFNISFSWAVVLSINPATNAAPTQNTKTAPKSGCASADWRTLTAWSASNSALEERRSCSGEVIPRISEVAPNYSSTYLILISYLRVYSMLYYVVLRCTTPYVVLVMLYYLQFNPCHTNILNGIWAPLLILKHRLFQGFKNLNAEWLDVV